MALGGPMASWRSRPFKPMRRTCLLLLSISIVLAIAAAAVSLISTPGPVPGLPNYTFLSPRNNQIITDMVFFSSLLFGIALVGLVKRPAGVYFLTSFVVFLIANVLFVLTLEWSIPVYSGGGVTVFAQPYPQTVYVLVWGLTGMVFSILIWYVERANRRLEQQSQASAAPLEVNPGPP